MFLVCHRRRDQENKSNQLPETLRNIYQDLGIQHTTVETLNKIIRITNRMSTNGRSGFGCGFVMGEESVDSLVNCVYERG